MVSSAPVAANNTIPRWARTDCGMRKQTQEKRGERGGVRPGDRSSPVAKGFAIGTRRCVCIFHNCSGGRSASAVGSARTRTNSHTVCWEWMCASGILVSIARCTLGGVRVHAPGPLLPDAAFAPVEKEGIKRRRTRRPSQSPRPAARQGARRQRARPVVASAPSRCSTGRCCCCCA